MKKGKKFIENLEKNSNISIIAHSDGDGVISAAIISTILKEKKLTNQSTLFILSRGEEAREKITKKTKNSDIVIFLDYTPNQKTYKALKQKKVLTIDHHPGRKPSKQGIYINPQKETPPPASVLCHLLYDQLKGQKDTKPWALIGAHSDTRLNQSLPVINLSKTEKEIYLPHGGLNRGLIEISNITLAAYLDKNKAQKLFKLIKKSIKQGNPLLIQEEKFAEAKDLYQTKRRAEKEKIKQIKNNENLEVYEDSKLIVATIKSDLRIKSMVADHLLLKYPEYTVAVAMKHNEKYILSFRGRKFNLSRTVSKACEGIEANGGGHPRAAGAAISSKHYDQFINNLKEYKRNSK